MSTDLERTKRVVYKMVAGKDSHPKEKLNLALHPWIPKSPMLDSDGNAHPGILCEKQVEPGTYLVVDIVLRDTHGSPETTARIIEVGVIPKKLSIVERSNAQGVFGANLR